VRVTKYHLREGSMRYGRSTMALVSLSVALAACDSYDTAGPGGKEPLRVIEASGDLAIALADFQAAVGDPANGGGDGPQPDGRREIRWDAVPPERTNTNDFPSDFFNVNVRAGLITTTDGVGFRVSDTDFGDVNEGYADEFESFSKVKTFMSVGSPRMTVTFRVPGSDTPGIVNGFGIVFSDVDRDGAASITLYAANGGNLGQYLAPVRSDADGHSFIGVVYDRPVVARVEVTSGEAALASGTDDLTDGGVGDLVITDDFLYGEPQPE
jgi:hypothetical protein